jgi:hypothetical protein
MNINLRALLFGTAVTAALTIAMNVVAAEKTGVIRLDAVEVVAHRDAFDADGNLKATRVEPAIASVHKDAPI